MAGAHHVGERQQRAERLGGVVRARDESWLSALEAIEATGLRRAYDFKTHGDLYLWTSQKLRELRTTDSRATWTDAAALLARHPVDRAHRRATLAARRKPLPSRGSRTREASGAS